MTMNPHVRAALSEARSNAEWTRDSAHTRVVLLTDQLDAEKVRLARAETALAAFDAELAAYPEPEPTAST